MASDWHASVAPRADPAAVRSALEQHWGLIGSLAPLYAERDSNFRLETASGTFLFKLSHPDTSRARLAYENAVLEQLGRADRAPAVPGPVATRAGATLVDVPGLGIARVLDWLPGAALDPATGAPEARAALGAACAGLNLALAIVAPPAAGTLPRSLPWDLQNLPSLADLRSRLPDPGLDDPIGSVLERFTAEAMPALGEMQRQPVHNDLNPDNLLFDLDRLERPPAVIDFGDMVEAPVVCDLAIACAYLVDDSGHDPLAGVVGAVRGFHRVRPLETAETALLPVLIAGRLCQTLLIQGARISGGQDASGELAEVVARAGRRLIALLADGLDPVRRRLETALDDR